MIELVKTKLDLCVGCNRCIRECPMEMANKTYQDENGNIKVKIDHDKCIGCGWCITACKHGAREFKDDTARFFEDLAAGIPISLIAAPATQINIPEYKRLFTYLKDLGVNQIYDVSLGADICIWAHVRHLEQNDSVPLITQPCPAIVTYCKTYRHDLLDNLSPIHSPMACTAIYMKQYEGITDRIAAISPCIAKSAEFADTQLVQYNVTFEKLQEYLEENDVELPPEETDFDHDKSGLGVLFPTPGGLKENIEFHLGRNVNIAKAEGTHVYDKLGVYAETSAERLPEIFDVLSCTEGCNIGPAVSSECNIFDINAVMYKKRNAATEESRRKHFKSLYQIYDKKLDRSLFMRKYHAIEGTYPIVTGEDIEKAFELLGKTDFEKQLVDCGACGSETCYQMARRIALGVNIPNNCLVRTMEEAKREHEENIFARSQVTYLEQSREADERMRIMLDSTPLGAQFWDKDINLIDCNQETLRLLSAPNKQECLEHFFEYFPEYQPDGKLSNEKAIEIIKKAFDEGYQRHDWMCQTRDGTPIPVEVTLVRVDYKGEYIVAAYTRDLREQKRMMQEIDANVAKLRAVVANYSGVIWCVDSQGIITLFDGLYLKEIGIPPHFIEGKNVELALQKHRHLDIIENVQKTLNGESQDWVSEIDGKMFHSRTSPIYGNGGDVTGVAGSTDDITETLQLQGELESALKEAEGANQALKSAQQTMSAMFESNPHTNILFNSDFEVIDSNPAAMRMMGFETKEEMLAGFAQRIVESIPQFQSDGRPSRTFPELFQIAAQEGLTRFETELILIGERRTLNIELKRIPYENSFAIVAYVFDITDIREREKELVRTREQNELQLTKLGLVVQATKIGLWEMEIVSDDMMNPANTFIWSDEFRHMLGFSDESDFPNVFGSWMDRLHPDDKEESLKHAENHLLDKTGNTPYDKTYRLLRKNGEYGHFRAYGGTARDEQGNALRIAGALMDITETIQSQERLESALKESENANQALKSAQQTVSTMFEANPHVNILFNSNFEIIDCNPAAVQFTGFETKEEMLIGFMERITENTVGFASKEETYRFNLERFAKAVEEGYCRFEVEIVLRGAPKSMNVEFRRIPYENDIAVVAFVFDTTEIRKREKELTLAREQNELQLTKLNLAVQATKIGLWEMEITKEDPFSPEKNRNYSNEFRQMLGFTDETDFPNVIGSWMSRVHPEDLDMVREGITRHWADKAGHTPYDMEYRLLKKNGEYGYFRVTGETVRDEEGTPLRAAGALLDITETKNILLETEKQRIAAEAANQAKSEFLSKMSHEIRTPMNAILGITEIQLRNQSLPVETKEALDKIYNAGDLLLGIINDVLDLSKIEAGKLELAPAKYDVASLINDVVTLNMMRIGSKPIEFELSVDEDMPATLFGDELRIKQVLNNILSNAIKYTIKGSVELSFSVEVKEGDDVILSIAVKDTGLGMTEEQVSRLFDAYTRFNVEANRTTEGTGLGMNITRSLVHLMSGKIDVKSEVNEGSQFTVQLPQQKIDSYVLGRKMAGDLKKFRTNGIKQSKLAQMVFEQMPDVRVLVVDDVESNLYVAKGLLAPYGLSVDTAISGYVAIDKIKEGNVYDVIFMDHMMPKMDGIETTKYIRSLGYKAPIVALTANVISGQSDIFLTNGFDDFVPKPIDVRLLNTVLKRFVRDKLPSGIYTTENQQETTNQQEENRENAAEMPSQLSLNPQLIEFFLQDAHKAIETLEAIHASPDAYDEEHVRTYIINVHTMKSVLAYMGEPKLSAFAAKLEQAGRERNIAVMSAETPAFLDRLRGVVEKLTPAQEGSINKATAEDHSLLREKLLSIKAACENFDKKTAKSALAELRKKKWESPIDELLSAMAEDLLNGDFEKVSRTAERIIGGV